MAKVYYERDVDTSALAGKTVAVIGYGSQGHAQAQNLRDSGVDVVVANTRGTPNWNLAIEHGFEPVSAAEATSSADLVQMLVPDELAPGVYKSEVAPKLKKGAALAFAHGFNIRFGRIVPPDDIDVVMVAPKGQGRMVRSEFVAGRGVASLVAVQQDASGNALQLALAYAAAIGSARAGIIETTFAEETETDLFGEQVVLCGGLTALVKAAFETLVEAGYQPEVCYFECLHELKLIVDLLYEGGITHMRNVISNTAEYGDLTRGPRIIGEAARREMKNILEEIASGAFATEWLLENQIGRPNFTKLEQKDHHHPIETVGRELRKMMKWIDQKEE